MRISDWSSDSCSSDLGQQALRAAPDVGPIMRGEAGLMADLKALSVPFAAHEHVAVFTVAESDAVTAVIPGAPTKNLFLKDAAGAFWLVTVPAEARVDLKALPGAIGRSAGRRVGKGGVQSG